MTHLTCDYFLVVDLEATCCDQKSIPSAQREIIEIGAVLLDRNFTPQSTFQTFVRPVRHPQLTPFCSALTTIEQSMVDVAPGYADAIAQFVTWLAPYSNWVFCAWGDFDRRQIRQDCKYHQVPNPIEVTCLNLKTMFARAQGLPGTYGMVQALDLAKLPLLGVHHRGIDDAQNIARLLPYSLGRLTLGVSRSR